MTEVGTSVGEIDHDRIARDELIGLLWSPEFETAWATCTPDDSLPTTKLPALEEAACFIFRETHTALEPLEGRVLKASEFRARIHGAQQAAKQALRLHREAAWISRLRRESCGGSRMLIVCHGVDVQPLTRPALKAKWPQGWVHLGGDGCGVVCRDSETRFNKIYCGECSGEAKQRRWESHEARLDAMYGRREARFPFLYCVDGVDAVMFEGPCERCGTVFAHQRPDAKRCERCR
jgi:hypothetical protein